MARRYLDALFDLARSRGQLDETARAIQALPEIFTREIREYFARPTVSAQTKEKLLEKAFEGEGCELIKDFCQVLAVKKRLPLIPELIRLCGQERCEFCNIQTARVWTPFPLKEGQREKLQAALENRFDENIELQEIVDSSLVGGLRVKVDDYVFDNSVAQILKNFKKEI